MFMGIVLGGGTYYSSDIFRCLPNRFGVAPLLMNYFEKNLQFVYEIKMGFDASLRPMDLVQIKAIGQALQSPHLVQIKGIAV